MSQFDSQIYIPHSALDGLPVKLSLTKIWDENNVLSSQIDEQYRSEKENYLIRTSIIINGFPVSQSKEFRVLRKNQAHDDQVIFPVSYKELSYNSLVSITIYSIMKSYDEQAPIASTTFPLFDEKFRLREGKQNLMLWSNVQADNSFDSKVQFSNIFILKTPGLVSDKNIENMNFCTSKIEQFESLSSQNQDVNENLALSNLRLKLLYCYKTIPAAFIEINLPKFPHPVFFESIEYEQNQLELTIVGGGYSMQNLGLIGQNLFNNPNQPPKQIQNQQFTNKMFIPLQNFGDCFQINDFESELQHSDPVADMILTALRHEKNPESLKPDQEQDARIRKLIKLPQITEMKSDESTLFYRYRYWILQFGEALPKFLNSIQWGNKNEEDEAMKLLSKWNQIHMEDALYLLSFFTSANDLFTKKNNKKPVECMKKVRAFAVQNLKVLNDKQIESILLQLVSGLKYEVSDIQDSSLAQFLFQRASQNKILASLLYWYLNVETDSNPKEGQTQVTIWYKQLLDKFIEIIDLEERQEIKKLITAQIDFRRKMLKLSEIRGMNVARSVKISELKKQLSSQEFQDANQLPSHQFCLNMQHTLLRPIPEKANIFSSAMAPMKFTFESITPDGEKNQYHMLFKNGDDLRQDQLVMQLFTLMDNHLKDVHLDMRLRPYQILACSKSDGFLEFIDKSETIQDILKQCNISQYLQKLSEDSTNQFYEGEFQLDGNDINLPSNQQKIKNHIEEFVKKSPMGIHPKIMENYVKSTAGYCVMTYFLGVGDRHLENVMMNNEGRMFHIDFGFIMGNDPKPYPPPFKLCKEMVEGMGGQKHKFYLEFKSKCIDVYLLLRKDAKLFISLLQLMSDAGIKDYSQLALENMYEKFRLDETNEGAEIHFLGIVEASVTSLFSDYTDFIHKIASRMRG